MKKYDVINFEDLEWYVLETNENTTKLLLKDVLDEERIKKYSEDDKYCERNEVRHSFNLYPPFNWENSYIKNVILPNFIKDLGFYRDNVEATLLSKEEVETLPNDVKKCNAWYWTKSDATDDNNTYAYAWSVYSDGSVNWNYVNNTIAVRPVLILPTNLIMNENTRQMACSEEYIEEFENMSGENQLKIIKTLMELALKKM